MSGDRDERPRRTTAEKWRPDAAPEDTAPPPRAEVPDPATWGRTVEEAQAMLARLMCPVCGEGPWKSPLNHVSRKHGIGRREMREACDLTTYKSVCAPELSARFVERGQRLMTSEAAREMTAKRDALSRDRRWTKAGRERVTANLVTWELNNPDEAARARSAAGKRGAAARWDT